MREPDNIGPAGEAWKLTYERPTTIAAWIVHLPHAHPFWPRYMISVVHLRDDPEMGSAEKQYPEAEYEFMIVALNPEKNPDPDERETWQFLQPINIVTQFHGCDDERAVELCRRAAMACIEGLIPVEPDDYAGLREQWDDIIRATARGTE